MSDPYNDLGLIHRLQNAVRALERPEPIQQRLRFAFANYLFPLLPEDFPEHRQEQVEALHEAVSWLPPEGTGPFDSPVEATTRAMSDEEAEKWVGLIVELYNELRGGPPS
jgi:hypothetical protein